MHSHSPVAIAVGANGPGLLGALARSRVASTLNGPAGMST